MSTTNAAITASRAFEQYFGPIRVREDTFVSEPSSDWSAEYSSGCVSMSEDVANWRDRFVGDTPSAAPLVRIWGAPAYAPEQFPLNAPFGSPPAVQRTVRLRVLRRNDDSSPALLSAFDQLNALLAFSTHERSAPELAMEDIATSPSLPPVVEAELAEFSAVAGVCPTPEAVRIARVLSEAAVQHVRYPDITVDSDGELSFDLRLKDGRLVFAELSLDGRLDVGVYGSDNQMLEHDADATCDYFLTVIES